MSLLKTRNLLLVNLFIFVAAVTFVLPAAATASSAAVRRNMMAEAVEGDLDEHFLMKEPTASPTKRPTAWELGDRGLNCNEVCYAIGGTCNVDAINAVDTLEKFQYVVEGELAFPVGDGVYMERTSPVNPLFSRSIFTKGFSYQHYGFDISFNSSIAFSAAVMMMKMMDLLLFATPLYFRLSLLGGVVSILPLVKLWYRGSAHPLVTSKK
jgi:hypothetical protein